MSTKQIGKIVAKRIKLGKPWQEMSEDEQIIACVEAHIRRDEICKIYHISPKTLQELKRKKSTNPPNQMPTPVEEGLYELCKVLGIFDKNQAFEWLKTQIKTISRKMIEYNTNDIGEIMDKEYVKAYGDGLDDGWDDAEWFRGYQESQKSV